MPGTGHCRNVSCLYFYNAVFLADLGSMSRKHPHEKAAAPVTGSGHLLRGHNVVLFSSNLLPSVVTGYKQKFVLTYIPIQFTIDIPPIQAFLTFGP